MFPNSGSYTVGINVISATAGVPVRQPLTDFLIDCGIKYEINSGSFFKITTEGPYQQKTVKDFLKNCGMVESA